MKDLIEAANNEHHAMVTETVKDEKVAMFILKYGIPKEYWKGISPTAIQDVPEGSPNALGYVLVSRWITKNYPEDKGFTTEHWRVIEDYSISEETIEKYPPGSCKPWMWKYLDSKFKAPIHDDILEEVLSENAWIAITEMAKDICHCDIRYTDGQLIIRHPASKITVDKLNLRHDGSITCVLLRLAAGYKMMWSLEDRGVDVSTKDNDAFTSKGAEYNFYLTQLEGKQRNRLIGLSDELYDDEQALDRWYNNLCSIVADYPESLRVLHDLYINALDDLHGKDIRTDLFRSRADEVVHALLYQDGKARQDTLNINGLHYANQDIANKWLIEMTSHVKGHSLEEFALPKLNKIHSRMIGD